MKEFEIFVYAAYTTDGGSEEHNCFKEYVAALTATEAKETLRAELTADGYHDIEMDEPIEVED